MKLSEHLKTLDGQNYSPRVVERPDTHGATIYYAWLPDWEGPARPDYAAAHADMLDRKGL
jgi:hypothetical protein